MTGRWGRVSPTVGRGPYGPSDGPGRVRVGYGSGRECGPGGAWAGRGPQIFIPFPGPLVLLKLRAFELCPAALQLKLKRAV